MAAIKKIILLVLTAVMMVGCGREVVYTSDDIDIVVIDSCEYLKCYTYGINSFVYTHKGNCKFCKERDSIKWEKHKKELEELVEQLKEK